MKAIIFNSGRGMRMGDMTKDKPKCMVELYNGETIFERQIRILSECGIKEFVVTTGPFREQLIDIASKFNELEFTFVENKEYERTNYIVSMNNADQYINDDVLLLHGDLVFNKKLISRLLNDKKKDICLYNKDRELPEKDFKGRFKDNILKEVSINIFDNDCYAFQPLYKLSKRTISKWKEKVKSFVNHGKVNVYAENALNTVLDSLNIYGMSYKDDYIEEIDNKRDYDKVCNDIKYFDYREQSIIFNELLQDSLKQVLDYYKINNIFVVSGRTYGESIGRCLEKLNCRYVLFNKFTSNPKYEEISRGIEEFKKSQCKFILSIGGGSAIDVAKCIKIFSNMDNELDFLKNKYNYNSIKHIAIPTTGGTGSESTRFAVMYYKGEKQSITHECILPDNVILDYRLLMTMSDYQKKCTMLDALCQSMESYWAKSSTDESRKYSEEAIKIILKNYNGYFNNDAESLKNIIIASNLSGKAINITKTTLPHAMSYKLTSLYKISHGHSVGLCFPYVWKYMNENLKDKHLLQVFNNLARILSCNNVSEAVSKLINIYKELNLSYPDMSMEDIEILTNAVNMDRLKNNPIIFSKDHVKKIYINIANKNE